MNQFALHIPLHSLSFGQIGVALCREIYRRNISPPIFVVGQPDLSAQVVDDEFNSWLQSCIAKAHKVHNRNHPTLRLWHISDSLQSYSKDQVLLTFHELDSLTPFEVHTCNQQKAVLVTSRYSEEVFKEAGVKNVHYVELGFDSDNFKILKTPPRTEVIQFLVTGKLEPLRKRHGKTLAALAKKYGNQREFIVNVATFNPFIKPEDQQNILSQIFGGKRYWNFNFIPFMQTNAEYNQTLNNSDIIVSMSGGEAFCLPTFHAVGLGKHCVALKATAYLDYLNNENAVLVEPSAKIKAEDGMFFHGEKSIWNVGNLFDYNEDDFLNACDLVVSRVKSNPVNQHGLNLQKRTYANTVDQILARL